MWPFGLRKRGKSPKRQQLFSCRSVEAAAAAGPLHATAKDDASRDKELAVRFQSTSTVTSRGRVLAIIGDVHALCYSNYEHTRARLPSLYLDRAGPFLRIFRPDIGRITLETQRFPVNVAVLLLFLSGACRTKKTWPVSFPQEELKKRLTPAQYHVTQERGTESAFTGGFIHHKDEGTYTCVVCGALLFSSNTKFDSGSGWPSFFDLVKEESVTVTDDFSYGIHRVETTCSQCGAHLGHLFDDGPRPTGKRYCINSASLAFQPNDGASPAAEAGASSSPASDGKTEL